MHLSHTPQYIIQTRNVLISILKGALWDIGQVRCGICEFGLFPFRKFLFFPFIVIVSHFIVILPPSIYSVKKYKKVTKYFWALWSLQMFTGTLFQIKLRLLSIRSYLVDCKSLKSVETNALLVGDWYIHIMKQRIPNYTIEIYIWNQTGKNNSRISSNTTSLPHQLLVCTCLLERAYHNYLRIQLWYLVCV